MTSLFRLAILLVVSSSTFTGFSSASPLNKDLLPRAPLAVAEPVTGASLLRRDDDWHDDDDLEDDYYSLNAATFVDMNETTLRPLKDRWFRKFELQDAEVVQLGERRLRRMARLCIRHGTFEGDDIDAMDLQPPNTWPDEFDGPDDDLPQPDDQRARMLPNPLDGDLPASTGQLGPERGPAAGSRPVTGPGRGGPERQGSERGGPGRDGPGGDRDGPRQDGDEHRDGSGEEGRTQHREGPGAGPGRAGPPLLGRQLPQPTRNESSDPWYDNADWTDYNTRSFGEACSRLARLHATSQVQIDDEQPHSHDNDQGSTTVSDRLPPNGNAQGLQ